MREHILYPMVAAIIADANAAPPSKEAVHAIIQRYRAVRKQMTASFCYDEFFQMAEAVALLGNRVLRATAQPHEQFAHRGPTV